MENIDKKTINTIKCLCADMIERAQSGHPGLPLGAATFTHALWAKVMNHNAKHPNWINRDRFILSAGHGSSLLYSLLHLYGYGLTMDDLKQFRQLGSLTPGHPEFGHTVGVEATTGPLGAGIAMAVGMAMAETHLAKVFNKPDYPLINHYTYVLAGDGCLMEGISSEALSLAGTLKLDKLIVLYDSNDITIEGDTNIAFQENVCQRMEAFGFRIIKVQNGDCLNEVLYALKESRISVGKPTFIEIKTKIGKDSNKEGKANAHGEPLGKDNVQALKNKLGFTQEEFHVDEDVYQYLEHTQERVDVIYHIWKKMFDDYMLSYPDMRKLWDQYFNNDYKELLNSEDFWEVQTKAQATRQSSGETMNMIKDLCPNFIGGSADLAPSTKTYLNNEGDYSSSHYQGRNLHFGIRELAMAGIGNGMMLYGGLKVFVSTFFVFSDYVKPMARLSALMKLPMTYILTHDSIGVGEDGPTHQPIEQLTMFRSMPNFNVFRPCDALETRAGWYFAMTSQETPTALVLSRQNLPQLKGSSQDALKGGYIIDDCVGMPDVIVIASGSEVSLAIETKKTIQDKKIRIVSMPCLDLFKQQDPIYQERILPAAIEKRIIVEAGSRMSWGEIIGLKGKYLTIDSFGSSAPANQLFDKFGFTVENLKNIIETI